MDFTSVTNRLSPASDCNHFWLEYYFLSLFLWLNLKAVPNLVRVSSMNGLLTFCWFPVHWCPTAVTSVVQDELRKWDHWGQKCWIVIWPLFLLAPGNKKYNVYIRIYRIWQLTNGVPNAKKLITRPTSPKSPGMDLTHPIFRFEIFWDPTQLPSWSKLPICAKSG